MGECARVDASGQSHTASRIEIAVLSACGESTSGTRICTRATRGLTVCKVAQGHPPSTPRCRRQGGRSRSVGARPARGPSNVHCPAPVSPGPARPGKSLGVRQGRRAFGQVRQRLYLPWAPAPIPPVARSASGTVTRPDFIEPSQWPRRLALVLPDVLAEEVE
jgi:hypothetical protein